MRHSFAVRWSKERRVTTWKTVYMSVGFHDTRHCYIRLVGSMSVRAFPDWSLKSFVLTKSGPTHSLFSYPNNSLHSYFSFSFLPFFLTNVSKIIFLSWEIFKMQLIFFFKNKILRKNLFHDIS